MHKLHIFLGHVTCGEMSAGPEFEFTNVEFPVPNETQNCSIQVI